MATFPSKVNYATGDILTATNMNDVGGAINALDGGQWAAGVNKILNGDMGIWQRGTSTTLTTNTFGFGPDRWRAYVTFSAGTSTFAQQTFTPGTAPVAGYEGQFFARLTCGSTSTYTEISQKIEDVRTFAGQTVTYSFWAKSSAAIVFTPYLIQQFGSGGSADVNATASNITLTSSWVRYSGQIIVPSVSGKTIGTGSALTLDFIYSSGNLNSATIDIWGVQLEGSQTATQFRTATGTKQGELAACQRYYYRLSSPSNAFGNIGIAYGSSTTVASSFVPFPVTMRVTTAAVDYSTIRITDLASGYAVTSIALDANFGNPNNGCVLLTVASGLTAAKVYYITNNNSTSAYLGFSAEL